jgi:2-dehydropantoate 2-reductase
VRLGIVGAGALGLLFAEALAPVARVNLFGRGDDPAGLRDADMVLVAVKTYDTLAALEPLRDVLAPGATIVSLQNGLLQVEQIEAALGAERTILLAPTTEGATRDGAGTLRRGGIGSTMVGIPAGRPGTKRVDALAELLRAAGLSASVADPIEPHLWAKLVVNAAINPVTALARRPNAHIVDDPAAAARASTLAREAADVARAAGIALPYADPVARVRDVARATGTNRSSMLQDIERGRPTEIEAINGEVVRRGRLLGVPTPENERTLDEVRRAAGA